MSGAVLPYHLCLYSMHRYRFIFKGKSSNRVVEDSYSVISQTNGGFITGGEEFSSLPSCHLSGPVCLLTKLSRESRLNSHRKESATGNSIR
jgi:hypothetical protein